MEKKLIKHGNHMLNDENNGYIYSFHESMGSDFNSHMHKCYEFIHIIKGHLIYIVEGGEYTLSDGDFIMTKPDEMHSFSFPEKCDYEREFIHIYPGFFEKFPDVLEKLEKRENGRFNYFPVQTVEKYGIDKIFEGMRECCEVPNEETDLMMLTYAVQLALKIHRALADEKIEYKGTEVDKKSSLIYKYVDKHYNEDITLEDIASAMFVSPVHASRIFKKETGMTVKTYLNMRRVNHAKNMIMEGKKATCIFDKCGFKDYSTFYRSFVKCVGMTPNEFKKIHDGTGK